MFELCLISKSGYKSYIKVMNVCLKFSNESILSLELTDYSQQNKLELEIFGYYKSRTQSREIVILNIDPAACNIIYLKPQTSVDHDDYSIPKIYIIDSFGNEQEIDVTKLLIEFPNSAKLTIQLIDRSHKCAPAQVQFRCYYGNNEYRSNEFESGDQYSILNIRPAACNVIYLRPEIFTVE